MNDADWQEIQKDNRRAHCAQLTIRTDYQKNMVTDTGFRCEELLALQMFLNYNFHHP